MPDDIRNRKNNDSPAAEGEAWTDDKLRQSFVTRIRHNTTIGRFAGVVVVVLLLILEIVIMAQSGSRQLSRDTTPTITVMLLLVCSLILDALCLVDIYVSYEMRVKIVVYTLEYLLLFIICIVGGTIYLAPLLCTVLTEMYISLPKLRDQFILLAVGVVLYIASCILGEYSEDPEWIDVATVVGDVLVGILIILAHFAVVNAVLWLYRLNRRLSASLKAEEESRDELKEVYRQLSESAVYEERNRIAGDIHDHVGHAITTVIMQTEAAKKLLDSNPKEAKSAIISANMQAKNALEQMRDSVHLLAGRGEGRSIKMVIDEICAQTMDGTDIKIISDVDDVQLGEMQYRITGNAVKEALSNGMRHGGASAFYIEFKREGAFDRLLISDNGTGLKDGYTEGYGLRRMRMSCEAIGAEMAISSEDGEGCELTLRLPVAVSLNVKEEKRNDKGVARR
ncbi:MAG: histidine kinase [Clostridia bacterium]|nr:histidine kinase [Clostridia bacterium]